VEEIPKIAEVRVDVWRPERERAAAFRLHTKVPLDTGEFVWNRNNCEWRTYGYRQMVTALGGTRIPLDLAKRSLLALDYDFGAVDVVKSSDNQWLVLEVNSAPNLGEVGIAQYAPRLERMLNANH
jgi:hypothetical protein